MEMLEKNMAAPSLCYIYIYMYVGTKKNHKKIIIIVMVVSISSTLHNERGTNQTKK